MEPKRFDPPSSSRSIPIIIGLALCFVANGCSILKPAGDEIGDGLLSEDGWDPFADQSRSRRDRGGADHAGEALAVDDDFVKGAGVGEIANSISRKPSGAVGSVGSVEGVEEAFKNGDYRKALAEARSLRAKSSAGSTDRDVADFVAAACKYYLGEFHEAQPILDAHVKSFPNSRHRESALYYQASNHVRLRQWKIGADLLDNYIASYPESLLLEFAMFDRATCHSELGEGSEAVKLIEKLERDFIYSKVRDRALVLKGDVLQESGDLAGAQAAYLRARTAAKELKHSELDARCLANLVAVTAARGQNETAVNYYESFFESYRSSPYATKAARGGLVAMKARGGLDSGLENMERVLQGMPQNIDASIMNETLVEYAKFYREKHGPEKLLRQLGNLSSSTQGSARLKEQLVIARLEALETYFPQNVAEIRVFYKEMRAKFKPRDLSATNVLKIADYIAEQNPEESIEWYDNALSRGGSLHRARATLGLAKAQARSGKEREAEGGFRKVLETFGSPELAEEATLGIARIARKQKDWNASAHYWTSYLDHQEWDIAREEARGGLEEAKGKGAVGKAPASKRTTPVKVVSADPVSKGLATAESQAASGNKNSAYDTLEGLLKRFGGAKSLPAIAKKPLSKARIMHEELGLELGR